MKNNPNAFVAALTMVFVWVISRVVEHFHLVGVTPNRILLAAGLLTAGVLWVGRTGIKGAALRLWDGANKVVNGHHPEAPKKS